ncbi:MAG: hypothetical protein ABI202_04035 [Candidatus Baltobacteraceae bacterium]
MQRSRGTCPKSVPKFNVFGSNFSELALERTVSREKAFQPNARARLDAQAMTQQRNEPKDKHGWFDRTLGALPRGWQYRSRFRRLVALKCRRALASVRIADRKARTSSQGGTE